jgi:hypothetical protein
VGQVAHAGSVGGESIRAIGKGLQVSATTVQKVLGAMGASTAIIFPTRRQSL